MVLVKFFAGTLGDPVAYGYRAPTEPSLLRPTGPPALNPSRCSQEKAKTAQAKSKGMKGGKWDRACVVGPVPAGCGGYLRRSVGAVS
jgi:hypothetical protein